MTSVGHLARRLLWSLAPAEPSDVDVAEVREVLTPSEMRLWAAMQRMDRRHSLMVLARRREMSPPTERDDAAAALLHDVGKSVSRLGAWGRVVATIVGPRGWRFRLYHRHDEIGIEMLKPVSNAAVIGLLKGALGPRSDALRRADEI